MKQQSLNFQISYRVKKNYMQIVKITSLLGMVFSIPLFIISLVFKNDLLTFHFLYLLLLCGLGNFICFLMAFLWSKSPSLLNKENQNKQAEQQNQDEDITVFYNIFGDVTFGWGCLQILINMLGIAQFWMFKINEKKKDYIEKEEQFDLQQYDIAMFASIFLLYILSFFAFLSVFSSFYCSVSQKTMKNTAHIYNMIFASVCIISASFIFIQLSQRSFVFDENITYQYINGVFWLFISAFCLSIGIFFVFFINKKTHINFFAFGTFLLLLIIILTGFSHSFYRKTHFMAQNAQKLSPEVYKVHKDMIQQVCNCQKYIPKESQECKNDSSLLKFQWESKYQEYQEVTEQPNQCLNNQCGMCFVYSQSKNLMYVSFGLISITGIAFLMVFLSFSLSDKAVKYQTEGKFTSIELIILSTIIVVGIAGIICCFCLRKDIFGTQPQQKLNQSTFLWQQVDIKRQNKQQCIQLVNLINEFTSFNFQPTAASNLIRVSLLAPSGNFLYENENSENLFVLENNEIKAKIFPFLTKNENFYNIPFISVSGKSANVNTFLNQKLQYCGVNPQNQPHFLIQTYEVQQQQKKNRFIEKIQNINHEGRYLKQAQTNNNANNEKQEKYCNYQFGDITNFKGSFSLITKPKKQQQQSQNTQEIQGRLVYYNSQTKQNDPLCKFKVSLYVKNEIGQRIELINGTSDDKKGTFSLKVPFPNYEYEAEMVIQGSNKEETSIPLNLGNAKVKIVSLGNIKLYSIFGKIDIPKENQCPQQKQGNYFNQMIKKKFNKQRNYFQQKPVYCPFEQLYNNQKQQLPPQDSKALMKQEKGQLLAQNISEIPFRNINVQLFDFVGNKEYNDKTIIKLHKQNTQCNKHNNQNNNNYVLLQAREGKGVFFNQPLGEYTLEINDLKENFHPYCQQFNVPFESGDFILKVNLIQKNESNFAVILEHFNYSKQGPQFSLGASFIVNEKKECLIHHFYKQCQQYELIEREGIQGILIKQGQQVEKKMHIFFVSKIPNSSAEYDAIENLKQNKKEGKVNNIGFIKENIIVKVYGSNNQNYLNGIQAPNFDNDDLEGKVNLSWNLFCFDGSKNDYTGLNQYYFNKDDQKKAFPHSSICQ